MNATALLNGNFETDWAEESSHRCLIIPTDGSPPREEERGNIFTPPNWLTWFLHGMPVEHDPANQNGWAQPEVRDAWVNADPRRVHGGQKAMLLFTFFRIHDAGFLQQVQVEPGTRFRLSAWVHAWSNHKDPAHPDWFPHPDDPLWSEGAHVGYEEVCLVEGQAGLDDGDRNFTFRLGIDPTGGTNPFAATVVWGDGAHIYNAHHEVPAVEVVAQGSTMTVFLRSRVLWPFKHCDAYWDDVVLEALGSEPVWGLPREQYPRTYVLLPPGAGEEWAQAVVAGSWNSHRYTLGGSADDAGIGALDDKTVVAVNPEAWRDDLAGFFQQHYPRTQVTPVEAATPDALRAFLEGSSPPPPPDEENWLPPGFYGDTRGHLTPHLQSRVDGVEDFIRNVRPRMLKIFSLQDAGWATLARLAQMKFHTVTPSGGAVERIVAQMQRDMFRLTDTERLNALSPDTKIIYRHWVPNDGYYINHPDPHTAAREFIALFAGELANYAQHVDFVESVNETIPTNNAAVIRRAVRFDCAFADELMALGLDVAPSLLSIAIGNPGEHEVELLLPAVEKACEYSGCLGYHAYWGASPTEEYLVSWWPYLAGRWQEQDTVFRAHGLYPLWQFGEIGAVSFDGHGFCPGGGWRDPNCENGDWGRYLAELMEFDRRVAVWNAVHGDRAMGGAVFTVGGWGWDNFLLHRAELESLAAELQERY